MFCITIALKDNPATWTLMFHKQEAAMAAWDCYRKARNEKVDVELVDDFGQQALLDPTCVAGAMLEDLDKSMLAHVERGLHNARTQAHAEKMAMNDPVLKTAAIAKQRGPAIYDPQGNGLGHR